MGPVSRRSGNRVFREDATRSAAEAAAGAEWFPRHLRRHGQVLFRRQGRCQKSHSGHRRSGPTQAAGSQPWNDWIIRSYSYSRISVVSHAFSALTMLVGQPVKLSDGVLAWLSVLSVRSEVQTRIWLSWCHCHSQSLASVKSRLVLPFWYRLTRVVPDKGSLNVCVRVSVVSEKLEMLLICDDTIRYEMLF